MNKLKMNKLKEKFLVIFSNKILSARYAVTVILVCGILILLLLITTSSSSDNKNPGDVSVSESTDQSTFVVFPEDILESGELNVTSLDVEFQKLSDTQYELVLNTNLKYIEAANFNIKVLSSSEVSFKPDVSFSVIENEQEDTVFHIGMGVLGEPSNTSFGTDQNSRLILGVFELEVPSNITFQILPESQISYNSDLININESTKSF